MNANKKKDGCFAGCIKWLVILLIVLWIACAYFMRLLRDGRAEQQRSAPPPSQVEGAEKP